MTSHFAHLQLWSNTLILNLILILILRHRVPPWAWAERRRHVGSFIFPSVDLGLSTPFNHQTKAHIRWILWGEELVLKISKVHKGRSGLLPRKQLQKVVNDTRKWERSCITAEKYKKSSPEYQMWNPVLQYKILVTELVMQTNLKQSHPCHPLLVNFHWLSDGDWSDHLRLKMKMQYMGFTLDCLAWPGGGQ